MQDGKDTRTESELDRLVLNKDEVRRAFDCALSSGILHLDTAVTLKTFVLGWFDRKGRAP